MSSPEPGRPEYERRVVRHLRRTPIEGDLQVNHLRNPVRFEEVRLEGAGSGAGSVVVTFRASDRPRCLFGRREDAVGPHEPWRDPQRDAPEGWAGMVWISLMEDLETPPALPKGCEPGATTWV